MDIMAEKLAEKIDSKPNSLIPKLMDRLTEFKNMLGKVDVIEQKLKMVS